MNESQFQWYSEMERALLLSGKTPRTRESYLRSIRQLVDHFDKDPQEITERELEDYFLFRRSESRWKPATLRLCYAGIKFYFRTVLDRSWRLFSILHVEDERTLPVVLTREEVTRILTHVTTFHNYVFLSTVYSCGLRLGEALALSVSDIDARAMLIHVRHGKGAKDRTVPLPQHTLALLRHYWLTHKHPSMIFPALGRGQKNGSSATVHMNRSSVQGAFLRARKAAGVTRPHVSIHTLRHSYATHLLEAGLNIRFIQRALGHGSLETTVKYLHLTRKGQADAHRIINTVMQEADHARRR